jgi:hypothetical protein
MPILGTVASQFAGKPFSSFESISTVSLNSSQASIEFTSIPATYTHLQFRFIVRTNRGNSEDAFRIKINGDTSAGNYNAHVLYGDGANDNAGEINTGVGWAGYYPTDSTSSVFGAGIMDFLDYANTNKAKTMRHLGGYDNNNGTPKGYIAFSSSLWTSTAAINSIVFTFDSGSSFTQYSQMALYGIKGA